MQLSDMQLSLICERACNLSERLSGQYVPTGGDSGMAARRLERWRKLAKQSMPCQLAALSSGAAPGPLSEHHLLDFLGQVRRDVSTPVPAWALMLNDIVGSLARAFHLRVEDGVPRTYVPPKTFGIPFEHLYWPIAELAWERVGLTCSSPVRIAPRARRSLQKHLIQRLSGVVSPLLHTAFLAHRAVEQSGMLQHLFGASAPGAGAISGTSQYESFVAENGLAGLAPFFMRHPVSARLVAELTGLWIEATREFFGRLHDDQNLLAARLNGGASLGGLSGVGAGLSDPHTGGRSVLILRFAAGIRIVYKPRPLQIDKIFFELTRELNNHCPSLGLGALRVVDRGSYGWVKFAQHSSCSSLRAAKRYYVRAGALAYLVHWLAGIDFHRENVVAAGEHPMLVDLESLAHPLRPEECALIKAGSDSALATSILRTGLLPLCQSRYRESALYDNSGLDGPISQRSLLPALCWHEVNTNRMRPVYQTLRHRHCAHRPTMKRRVLTMRLFEREVIDGFRIVADTLQGLTSISLHTLRDAMFRQSRRRIKRATLVYAVLLRCSLDPACSVEGIDRSIELMSLPCLSGEGQDWLSEIRDLEKLDVPYFLAAKDLPALSSHPNTGLSTSELNQAVRTVRLSIQRKIRLQEGRLVLRQSSVGPQLSGPGEIKAAL